jgi:hypothetical protein
MTGDEPPARPTHPADGRARAPAGPAPRTVTKPALALIVTTGLLVLGSAGAVVAYVATFYLAPPDGAHLSWIDPVRGAHVAVARLWGLVLIAATLVYLGLAVLALREWLAVQTGRIGVRRALSICVPELIPATFFLSVTLHDVVGRLWE